MLADTWWSPANLMQGAGGALVVLGLGWVYARWDRRRRVRAAEIDTSQAKDKSDRELLEQMYSVLITADPTPLNKTPAPGLIDRVANIEQALAHRSFEGDMDHTGHMSGTVGSAPEATA